MIEYSTEVVCTILEEIKEFMKTHVARNGIFSLKLIYNGPKRDVFVLWRDTHILVSYPLIFPCRIKVYG